MALHGFMTLVFKGMINPVILVPSVLISLFAHRLAHVIAYAFVPPVLYAILLAFSVEDMGEITELPVKFLAQIYVTSYIVIYLSYRWRHPPRKYQKQVHRRRD